MKNLFSFFLIGLLILFFSCGKEKIKIDPHWGKANAMKNGAAWHSLPSAGISNLDGKLFISCNTYTKEGYHRELLHLFKLPLAEGSYKVDSTSVRDDNHQVGAVFITSTDDGDVMGDIYHISTLDSLNEISIIRITGKEIRGTFRLTMFRDIRRAPSRPDIPDTLRFEDGKFHTKIFD
jgi:hypothetical protein